MQEGETGAVGFGFDHMEDFPWNWNSDHDNPSRLIGRTITGYGRSSSKGKLTFYFMLKPEED